MVRIIYESSSNDSFHEDHIPGRIPHRSRAAARLRRAGPGGGAFRADRHRRRYPGDANVDDPNDSTITGYQVLQVGIDKLVVPEYCYRAPLGQATGSEMP